MSTHTPDERARAARVGARAERIVAVALTVLVLALHVFFARHAGALWRDEADTANLAAMPIRELWSLLGAGTHPILGALVIKAWTATFGGTDVSLRLFGLLAGVAGVGVLWLSALEAGNAAPLTGLTLFALSPITIRYGDSVRPYGLAVLFTLFAFVFVRRLVAGAWPRSAVPFGGALLSSVAAVHTIYQALPIVLSITLAGAVIAWRRGDYLAVKATIAIGVVAAAQWAMYLPALRRAADWAVVFEVDLGVGFLFQSLLNSLGIPALVLHLAWIAALGVCLVVAVGDATAACPRSAQTHQATIVDDRRRFALLAMASGMVGTFIFLRGLHRPAFPWHWLALLGLVAPALDTVVGSLPAKRASVARTIGALAVAAIVLAPTRLDLRRGQTNVAAVAEAVQSMARPDDLILTTPWYHAISFGRYYRGLASWMSLPPLDDLRTHRYDRLKQVMASTAPLASIESALMEKLRSGQTVWIVGRLPRLGVEQMPLRLPPAPLSRAGWFSAAYEEAWSTQIAWALQHQALELTPVALVRSETMPFEDLTLLRARGYRGAQK